MSATDDFNYTQWGRNNYHTICGLILESALYGIYSILVAYSFRHLWFTEKDRTRGRIITLLSLLVMFAMSTTLWAIDITNFLGGLQKIIINTDGTASQRSKKNTLEINPRVIAQTIMFSFEYIVGDSVVVWRACALWGYDKRVMFLPIFFLISATVMVFFFLGCLGVNGWSYVTKEPVVCANSYTGVLVLSISINCLATGLIATKAWMHHRVLLSASVKKTTRVLKVLILLVESGLIYLIIWTLKSLSGFNGTFSSTPSDQFFVSILNKMGNQVVGLYPTLLVVLVHMQLTAFDADLELRSQ
ncbi:hypothetical protein GYMLUDRAFT_260979 [Collybiopsis luxurians FD-317 M1]|uniref:Uncharacterized protein n=1 Tax=Collybiopsis luxurians FD-317 M1 TaxID=944289 RepID=A0A0D0CQ00_9AGAR|nr:hypothetical protein GYMLUDRAFT_260979 [Collybiopsis luxurians FD-317 M1]